MQKLTLFLGNGIIREVICPYSDKNAIKEWLRTDRKSTRLNSSHGAKSRMPSSA